MIQKLRATKGKLGFPPAYHVIMFHIRLLLYKIPSFYPELEDFITTQNDALNKQIDARRNSVEKDKGPRSD